MAQDNNRLCAVGSLQNGQVFAAGENYLLTGCPLMGDPIKLHWPLQVTACIAYSANVGFMI